MALGNINNGMFAMVGPGPYGGTGAGIAGPLITMTAANRGYGMVGRLRLENPSGGSKTISAAGGGKLCWLPWTSPVFANGGTNLRIGIQDIASTGLGDTNWDVYADMVGGVETITQFVYKQNAMTSGTKTMNDGDIIGIFIEMTARGGADSIGFGYQANSAPYSNNSFGGYPYWLSNTGGTYAKGGTLGGFSSIIFDDGTIGWIDQNVYFPASPTGTDGSDFSVSSSPDEYGPVWSLPFKCRVYGGFTRVLNVATADAFEYVLYSNAKGTPTIVETITANPQHFRTGGGISSFYFATPRVLEKDVIYAIGLRPTSANAIATTYLDLGSGNSRWKKLFPFSTLEFSGRTNQSGAFVEVQNYYAPIFGLYIDQLDDGVVIQSRMAY